MRPRVRQPQDAFAFPNGIPPTARGMPGGCTRDLVHKFYQEQYQLNGGAQNRYATGSDSAGTVMGVYNTRALPIYQYLHSGDHPHYAIADDFFQAAFGGSFLNHQWLIAARDADGSERAGGAALDDRLGGLPDGTTIRCTTRIPRDRTATATSRCRVRRRRPASPAATGRSTRCSRRNEPFGLVRRQARAAERPDDRRRAQRAPASRWGWYAGGWDNAAGDTAGPGWTNGTGADVLRIRTHDHERGVPLSEVPGLRVPVPSPAVLLLRELCARTAARAYAPPRRGGVRERCAARRRPSATSTRSASSSRSARRTSIRATRASPTAART